MTCWCQAIIWTNAGLISIKPFGTNFSEILVKMQRFKKIEIVACILPAILSQPHCVKHQW